MKLFLQHAGTYIHTWEVEALVDFLRRSLFPGKRWRMGCYLGGDALIEGGLKQFHFAGVVFYVQSGSSNLICRLNHWCG